jgi:flagellar basal-body rod modification protein FlgD
VIDPVTGAVTGEVTTPPKSANEAFGAGMGKDTFLKLLVAQLKYQNPLSPTNSEQFMAQMAQFTQVEKLAEIGKAQADLVTWQRNVAGQGMIGKQITASVPSGGEVTGLVVGVKLADTGPRLILSNGTTVGVDEVTSVESPTSQAATAPAASTPPSSTPPASTPAASTPAATTPTASTPPATTPATGATPAATGSGSGTGTTGTGAGTDSTGTSTGGSTAP